MLHRPMLQTEKALPSPHFATCRAANERSEFLSALGATEEVSSVSLDFDIDASSTHVARTEHAPAALVKPPSENTRDAGSWLIELMCLFM